MLILFTSSLFCQLQTYQQTLWLYLWNKHRIFTFTPPPLTSLSKSPSALFYNKLLIPSGATTLVLLRSVLCIVAQAILLKCNSHYVTFLHKIFQWLFFFCFLFFSWIKSNQLLKWIGPNFGQIILILILPLIDEMR